jgi:quercetin dioxygenase-like cupin family protein
MSTLQKRILRLYLVALLLLSGCAGIPTNRQQGTTKDVYEKTAPIESVVLAKTTSSWNGSILPEFPGGQPEITILRIKIPPGTSLPMHKHPVINAGVLLKGQLTVKTKDGEILHLKEGESIVEVVNIWHSGKNEGSVPAEIIVFYAGVKDIPITVYEK